MQFQKTDKGYMLRFIKGEKLGEALVKFCESEQITAAAFHGIGGFQETTLGYFHMDKKDYEWKVLNEKNLEIVSLNGNISLSDGKPFVHMHAIVSDETLRCFGGHLKEAIVSPTCEIALYNFPTTLIREYNEELGIKLLQCTSSSH